MTTLHFWINFQGNVSIWHLSSVVWFTDMLQCNTDKL